MRVVLQRVLRASVMVGGERVSEIGRGYLLLVGVGRGDPPDEPERLAERIEAALADPDPRRALLTMTELQLETVQLAPSGPMVDRARKWLAEGVVLL
ncbi:MAG TPA: D-aminoacyl-tRNA deacylase, partial [Actinomycetota bacterium]|nr:D-aminoacyl-tRNA deacylase [Actinomycetota bacterium]